MSREIAEWRANASVASTPIRWSVSPYDTFALEDDVLHYIDGEYRSKVDIGCRSIHMKLA
jgi:hypothetical protein